jgi:hypothetical protein
VRRFRNIWFALAAFLWLPAVAQCQLESLTGLEFLQCHQESAAAHSSSKDCDTCCTVEKSQFPSALQRLAAPQPDWLPLLLAAVMISENQESSPADSFTPVAAPPDLPVRWQFVFRAALPVRAPSFVS